MRAKYIYLQYSGQPETYALYTKKMEKKVNLKAKNVIHFDRSGVPGIYCFLFTTVKSKLTMENLLPSQTCLIVVG